MRLWGPGVRVVDLRGLLPTHKYETFGNRNPNKIEGLVLHHTGADGNDEDQVYRIARYHSGKRSHLKAGGAPGIAYWACVGGDGTVYVCWDLGKITWSQGTRKGKPGYQPRSNARFLAVLVMGNFASSHNPQGSSPTPAQMYTARKMWTELAPMWGWTDTFFGHVDFGKPACPGDMLYGMIRNVRRENTSLRVDLSTMLGRQKALVWLGFDVGESGVDGVWGLDSKMALRAFQSTHDLDDDGMWGPKTDQGVREALRAREA